MSLLLDYSLGGTFVDYLKATGFDCRGNKILVKGLGPAAVKLSAAMKSYNDPNVV